MLKKARWCPHPKCGVLIKPSSKKGVEKHFIKAHGRKPTDAEIDRSVNSGLTPVERLVEESKKSREMMEKRNELRPIPIACEAVAWEFKCPKQWAELEATEREDVRHCASCSQEVYLCTNAAELNNYARRGLCVAWDEKGPEEISIMTLGYPLATFLDKDG